MIIHLYDEARRIGSGRRRVEVLSRGPKWVTVKYAPLTLRISGDRRKRKPITVVIKKFHRNLWDQIERRVS